MGFELGPKFHLLLHQNVDFCPFKIIYTSKWLKVAHFFTFTDSKQYAWENMAPVRSFELGTSI